MGWIDGLRKSIDDASYKIRFSPRRPTSNWSEINIARVAELTRQQRMRPAGLEAFARRVESKSRVYAYEQRKAATFDAADEKTFRGNATAWKFLQAQSASYRMTVTWWVVSAKRVETRRKRLERLIQNCAAERRLL